MERGESPFHPLFIFSNLMSTLRTNLYVGECVCQEFGVNKFLEFFVCADFIITTTANDQQQNNNNSSDNKIENHETCWLWVVLVLVLLA